MSEDTQTKKEYTKPDVSALGSASDITQSSIESNADAPDQPNTAFGLGS